MNLHFSADHMDEILLLTVQSTGQAGDDLLIFPMLSADESSLGAIDRRIEFAKRFLSTVLCKPIAQWHA